MKTIQVQKGSLEGKDGYLAREAAVETLPDPKDMLSLRPLYEKALENAAAAQAETACFPAIPAAELNSTMFQAISIIYKAMKTFQASHPYPRQICIFCEDDEVFRMYMVVWNLYYAEDKSQRMNDGRWD